MLDKTDKMLITLVDLAYNEVEKSKSKWFFSKDLAEACGIIISLAYERWGRDGK